MHVDRVRAGVKSLREEAEKIGRDPKTIEVCPQFVVHVGKTRQAAITKELSEIVSGAAAISG